MCYVQWQGLIVIDMHTFINFVAPRFGPSGCTRLHISNRFLPRVESAAVIRGSYQPGTTCEKSAHMWQEQRHQSRPCAALICCAAVLCCGSHVIWQLPQSSRTVSRRTWTGVRSTSHWQQQESSRSTQQRLMQNARGKLLQGLPILSPNCILVLRSVHLSWLL